MSRKSLARSLAPLGQTMSTFQQYLNRAGNNDPEWRIASLWADLNRQKAGGEEILPVQLIAHQCTQKCRGGHHEYDKLDPKQVQLISATVQWFATPAGREFHEKFLHELHTNPGVH